MLSQRLLEFSLLGAEWVLWVLVVLSVVSVAVAIERLALFWRTREDLDAIEPALAAALAADDLEAAARAVAGDSMVRNVLRAGVAALQGGARAIGPVEQAMLGALARERSRYDRGLVTLGTIGNNAPFVGLFGTVLGIIQAFHELGKMDPNSGDTTSVVMAGVSEALVATGVGILVAIPAVAAYNAARSHIAGRAKAAEALLRALLAGLRDPGPAEGS